ncbi:hypothetical protein LCGC14_0683840 [marine sediment metagenome]|uniref:TadE-like domain-containing protein n=2 Tax=root TaxID=1 RepID=A0A831R797_9GAMM|nr:TadE/TadG family type IV pilus assembly protein [Marinobacter antarcticus]HEA53665.1 hypothetical protein [Marinobacter antarcticus]
MSPKQSGQALVEMIVVAPLIIAIAAGIMAIAMYLQAKTTTVAAARFAVWERSVWADPDHPWSGGDSSSLGGSESTVIRPDFDIFHAGLAYATTPSLRIRSDRNMAVVAASSGRDHKNPEVLSWGGSTQSGYKTFGGNVGAFVKGTREDSTRSAWEELSSRYSFDLTRDEQDVYLASDSLQDFGIEPLANRGLELPTDSVLSAEATLALPNVFHALWSLGWLDFNDANGDTELRISSTASLLTNSWAPKNEKVFIQKVHGLDIKPLADYITAANEAIGSGIKSRMGAQSDLLTWIPIFGDILLAKNPILDVSSVALPFTRVIPEVDAVKPEVNPLLCGDSYLC